MKKIVIIIMCLFMCSCSIKQGSEVVGNYETISCVNKDGEYLVLDDETLCLKEDGTGNFIYKGITYELRWSYDGSALTFKDDSGDTFTGEYELGIIKGTYFYDYYYTFAKVNDDPGY